MVASSPANCCATRCGVCGANADPKTDTDPYPNAKGHTNAHTNANAEANTHTYAYTNADADTKTDTYSNTNTDANRRTAPHTPHTGRAS